MLDHCYTGLSEQARQLQAVVFITLKKLLEIWTILELPNYLVHKAKLWSYI